MKLSFKSKPKSETKKTILFVCIENAGRSQMAEAFFRKYAPSIQLHQLIQTVFFLFPLTIAKLNNLHLFHRDQQEKRKM